MFNVRKIIGHVVWLTVLGSVLDAGPAYAYLDPGSGSMLTTLIMGAIAAVIYTFRKYFYKFMRLFKKSDSETID